MLACLRLLNISFLFCFFCFFYLSGQSVEVYNYFNSPVPDNRINSIEIDSSNTLWVGTQYGLVSYDGFSWVDFSDSVNSPVIRDVSVDRKGNVWVATNSGFCKYDSVWRFFTPPFQSLNEQINCISFDNEDDPWFGTVNGLFSFKNNSFSLVLDSSSLENFVNVSSISFKGDSVVVGTMNGGIGFIYNGFCSWLNISPIGGIVDNSFDDLLVDESNNIWGCSPYGGVQVFLQGSGWYFINTLSTSGWPSNSVTSIDSDSVQIKYLGTKGGGLIVLDLLSGGVSFSSIDSSNSDLPDNFILDVIVEGQNIWLATQFEGLVKMSFPSVAVLETEKEDFVFYPVPFKNKINFCSSVPKTVCVYSLDGVLLFSKKVFSFSCLNLDFLPSGLFLFSVEDYEKKHIKKIIKL
ncbi:MAG: hypothetical protein CMP58_00300 [Flavobacteriales bacterium]|nr:hypothetical protein [Flavobacteriales bacterium]